MSKAFRTREERGDAFIDAAGLGHIVEVQRLIAEGEVDVNAHDNSDESNTALILASQNGRPMVVNALIAAGADVNAANKNGDTPLILASLNGHAQIVDALRARANVHATDQFGSCALFYASRQGHCGLVDALVDAGADVNHSRVTALLIASRFGHASAVAKLLAAGADVECVDDDGNTALHRCALETTPGAVYGGRIGEVAELLVEACIDTEAKNDEGKRAWDLARRGMECGTSEWQKVRCRELAEVLEDAREMTVGLRHAARGRGRSRRARVRADGREGAGGHRHDRARRARAARRLLAPIPANRFFRASGGLFFGRRAARAARSDTGARHEQFLAEHKLDEYECLFASLGVAFERDLLDVTEAQLDSDGGAPRVEDSRRRRFDKAARALGGAPARTRARTRRARRGTPRGGARSWRARRGGGREETERGERRTRQWKTADEAAADEKRAPVRPDRANCPTKKRRGRVTTPTLAPCCTIHTLHRDVARCAEPARDDALHPRARFAARRRLKRV